MATMPRERTLDSTPAILVEGYEFISNRCRRLGSDVFETRLYLRPTICMRGRDAAELFYDTDRFVREDAAPATAGPAPAARQGPGPADVGVRAPRRPGDRLTDAGSGRDGSRPT